MKQLPVRGGLYALVDDEDFPLLSEYRWCLHHYVQTTFWIRNKPKGGLLHRVILNAPPGKEVDHIDGNKLNNQKSNLRLCDHAENQRNRRLLNKNNHSGAKGVYFDRRRKRWYSQVTLNGKAKTVGSGFMTIKEAVESRNLAAQRLHGAFYAPSAL